MDTIIGVVVMVGISVLMAWLENRKKDASSASKPARKQAAARPQRVQQQSYQQPVAQQRPTKPVQTQKPKKQSKPKAMPKPMSATLPEEGMRVTSDIDIADSPISSDATLNADHGAGLPPLPAGDLRAAVIWGEILNRKF